MHAKLPAATAVRPSHKLVGRTAVKRAPRGMEQLVAVVLNVLPSPPVFELVAGAPAPPLSARAAPHPEGDSKRIGHDSG